MLLKDVQVKTSWYCLNVSEHDSHILFIYKKYCKSGNIHGINFLQISRKIQQVRIQKPTKIFAIVCMHILDT